MKDFAYVMESSTDATFRFPEAYFRAYRIAYRIASTNPRCTALVLMLWSFNLFAPLRICYIVCYGLPKTILLRVLRFLKLKDESFQHCMALSFLRYIISR